MPKHKHEIDKDGPPSKKAKPHPHPIGDAEAEPDFQLQEMTNELIVITAIHRDASMIIAKYTRPYFGECVGPEVTITQSDGLLNSAEYYNPIWDCLIEHLDNRYDSRFTHDNASGIKTLNIWQIVHIIHMYVSIVWNDFPTRSLVIAISDCNVNVYRNVIYFYDCYEKHVHGFIAMGDSDTFQFVRDGSLDVFVDLNRRIKDPCECNWHNHTDIYDTESSLLNPYVKSISIYDPLDVQTDVTSYSSSLEDSSTCSNFNIIKQTDEGFTIKNRFNNEKSSNVIFPMGNRHNHIMIFEPKENRFIQMILDGENSATFQEVIIHQYQPTSFKPLKSSENALRYDALQWRWFWYQGIILGYDSINGSLTLVHLFGDNVLIKTFKVAIFRSDDIKYTNLVLCGRYLVIIMFHNTHISVQRLSLDLRVLRF